MSRISLQQFNDRVLRPPLERSRLQILEIAHRVEARSKERRAVKRAAYRAKFPEDFPYRPNEEGKAVPELMEALIAFKEGRYEAEVEATENKVENFLALVSGGSIVVVATVFQGKADTLSGLSLAAIYCFIVSILLISLIKVQKLRRAYWQRGEWWKSRNAYMFGKLNFDEMIWRSENSWKNLASLELLACLSLVSSIAGFGLLFISLLLS